MSKMREVLSLFLLILFFSNSALAQKKSVEPKIEEVPNSRIVSVLLDTAEEAKTWEDAKTSAQVSAQIADTVWQLVPIQAEGILVDAWNKSKDVKEKDEKPSEFRNYSNRLAVSREVLLIAKKRNSGLAEKWLKELSDIEEENFAKRNKGKFDDRTAKSSVLLAMAMQVADTDINLAASLARESLNDGISFGFQSVLLKIQEKNPALAQSVFRSALQRLETVGIVDTKEILILNSYVYTPGRISAGNTSSNQGSSTIAFQRDQVVIKSLAELNPNLANEFLEVSARAILKLSYPTETANPENNAREQYSIITTVLSRLRNQELVQSLQQRLNQIMVTANYSTTPETSPSGMTPIRQGEKISEYRSRLLDEALEEAEKLTNNLQRDIVLTKACVRSDVEDFEKAKNVASKIDDKKLKEQVTNFLIYRKSLSLIKKDEFDETYKLLNQSSEPKQKTAILIIGGQKLFQNKNKIEAQDWLLDAQKKLDKNKDVDSDWLKLRFGFVSTYQEIDKISALQVFYQTAKLLTKDVSLAEDDKAPLAISFEGFVFADFTHGTKGFSLLSAIKSFPKQDFEDVLGSLQTIKNPALKGLGILAHCKRHLKPVPNTSLKTS
jgi:hypothetical protein